MLDKMDLNTISENVQKSKMNEKIDFEDAMLETGFGKFNVFSVMYCGFMLLGMIMETLGFSYIIPASQCDLELSLMEKTWISVIPFIAIIVTSHMWGYLADTRGRKKILLICTSVGSTFSILSSLAPNTVTFGIMRFVAGVFIAGPSALGYAYLGELNPKTHRDMMLTLGNASVGFGTAIVPLIAWGILPLDFHWNLVYLDYRPWRLLVCLFALPYLICALLMYKFPESPKFLAARGHHEEALNVLKHIYSINTGKRPESFPVLTLKSVGEDVVDAKKSFLNDVWNQTAPLFRKKYLIYTALTSYLQFVIFATTNGFYIWFPFVIDKLLNRINDETLSDANLCTVFDSEIHHVPLVGDSNSTKASVCDDSLNTGTFTITMCLSIIVTILTISAAFSIKYIGKKVIVATIFLITAVAGLVLNWITGIVYIICIFAMIQVNGVCIGVVNAYVVEIFPTNVRAMAVCLTMMIGRIGSMSGSNIIGYLMHYECPVTFFLFGGLLLSCFLVVQFLPKSDDKQPRKDIRRNKNTDISSP